MRWIHHQNMKSATYAMLLLLPACQLFGPAKPIAIYSRGAVAAPEPLAAQIGAKILEQGGNAADAAVAVSFALAVTNPQASCLGGGGLALYQPINQEIVCLNFLANLPRTSSDFAVGIPGTVKGLEELHHKFGSLAWNLLLEPAAQLAEQGFIIDRKLGEKLAHAQERLLATPATQTIFAPYGKILTQGQKLVQKDLAATIHRIGGNGATEFYQGETSKQILQALEQIQQNNAALDLQAYQVAWQEPLAIHYANFTLFTPALPSRGGIALAEMLNIMEGLPLASMPADSPHTISFLIEASRFAQADQFLGQAAVQTLISKAHAQELLQKITPLQPSHLDSQPHNAAGYSAKDQTQNLTAVCETDGSGSFSIIDRWGNAIVLSYSLTAPFGSGLVAEKSGILLNRHCATASFLCPTLVTQEGKLVLALGSAGNETIPTTLCRIISACLLHNIPLENAVKLARFHHALEPDQILLEENHPIRYSAATQLIVERLQATGYEFAPCSLIGEVHAIAVSQDAVLQPIADFRGRGDSALTNDSGN